MNLFIYLIENEFEPKLKPYQTISYWFGFIFVTIFQNPENRNQD